MKNQIFPIVNDAACLYKWTWSTIFLSRGTTSSCHRCRHWEIDENTILDFHNHPGKVADREKMVNGEWPGNGCEYCRDVEQAGGASERTTYINYLDNNYVPKELFSNPTATTVTPRLLEVYFSNVCNQSCVYCTPGFSSQIEAEVKRFGASKYNLHYSNSNPEVNYDKLLDRFWEWMRTKGHELTTLQVLGGEPMYQKEFDMCLDFFNANPNPNLEWRIFSNLKHDSVKFKEKIDRVRDLIANKKIRSMEIVASLDCWGPEIEYARYGVKIDEWERNMLTVLNTEGIGISVHSTITPLTLPSMYQLFEKIAEWRKIKMVRYSWNTVVRPEIFNPYNFGPHLIPHIDRVLESLPPVEEWEQPQVEYFKGIRQQMSKSTVDKKQIQDLVGFLSDIDARRRLNWQETFPSIASLVNELDCMQ